MTGRILHIGLGNFARAHLADFTQDAGGWRILGVSLRSASVRDGLAAQGFGYGLWIHGQPVKPITVIEDVLVAPENPQAVLDCIGDPGIDIISVTVTEKGYHLDARNRLDLTDPAIASDLAGHGPQTVIGFLARGLAARQAPVTILSCDNRVSNGDALGQAVADFAGRAGLSLDLAAMSFPNAMVDRITPATTDTLRERARDPMVVPTEPFREWVIEDRFLTARPDWPEVQFVEDVAPHELRKLRMLNGAHSMLAYAGLLAGYVYVHEAIADPELRSRARQLMAEAGDTLTAGARQQAPSYADALIARFDNRGVAHELRQIAMDGSQKIPYRIVDSLLARQTMGLASPALQFALRSWIAFCRSEVAARRDLADPRADEIAAAARGDAPDAALARLVGAVEFLS